MQTTVFYSYKGGLGRSLALAWCARALAREGKPTVAIDFDLEAPGLAYKLGFSIDDDLGPGLVDLLLRYQSGQSPPDDLGAWLKNVEGDDQLWLLPAGPGVSGRYWRDLAAINWDRMFFGGAPDGVRFFHWLRQAIEKTLHPEHLLVDARTGVTEMGGAALTLMADQILALLGTSLEGIHGTREVLRGVVASCVDDRRAQPRIGLVLSRMPSQLSPDELLHIRRTTRDAICTEAEPLSATVHTELPLIVRSEPCLHTNEQDALRDEDLRVQVDYRAMLLWISRGSSGEVATQDQSEGESTVEALSKSVELHRRLAAQRPDLYEADLAACLGRLSRKLTELGQREKAVAAAEEAVKHYRLAELGRHEEAIASAQQAVQHYRDLERGQPDAFLPGLASSLSTLGHRLSELGRCSAALDPATRAVELYRRLTSERPNAFRPELAASLRNLGNVLAELGRHEEALRTDEEAMQVYLELTKPQTDKAQRDLAIARSQLGSIGSEATPQEWWHPGDFDVKDAEAWRGFIERFRPFVRGILGGILGPDETAAEAEGEFWGHLWMTNALDKVDRNSDLRPFIEASVRSFARRIIRKKRNSPDTDGDAIAAAPAVDYAETERRLRVEKAITSALATLREAHPPAAKVLALHYGIAHGKMTDVPMSSRAIAASLGMTTNRVYVLIDRGRKLLRNMIEHELLRGSQHDTTIAEEHLGLAATRLPGLLE